MTHTVDTLMALADGYANSYMTFHEKGMREALRTALTEALAQPYNADPSCTTVELAEMILSDCGCSSNNTSLVSRVANRIDAHMQAAQPVRGPSPGACKTCGNEYLASRTDVYKDKRPFIYCDCCGAMADSKTWYLTHGIGGDK